MVRNNEVIKATIPAEKLFAPNETKLHAGAEELLNDFRAFIDHPEMYRLIVAVYADDSGDEQYSFQLTEERAMAVKKAFTRMASAEVVSPNIDYYWFGNTKFAYPNNSLANRAKNRRIEIYIVPEAKFIDASKTA